MYSYSVWGEKGIDAFLIMNVAKMFIYLLFCYLLHKMSKFVQLVENLLYGKSIILFLCSVSFALSLSLSLPPIVFF